MAAHIEIDVKFPPSAKDPTKSWCVSAQGKVSTLEYKTSACTCKAELVESRGCSDNSTTRMYTSLNGWKYRKLVGLKQEPKSQGLVEWLPTWVANDHLEKEVDGRLCARREGLSVLFEYRGVIATRAADKGEDYLLDWAPTWEDLAMLDRKSVEEFEREYPDILDLLKIVESIAEHV
ncbi:hypothetical protein BDV12DRAFT_179446 [Aspergillus spectabilis]